MTSFYVSEQAVSTIRKLVPYLAKYGLHIHKINSNDPEVLTQLEVKEESTPDTVVIELDQTPRALGVTWDKRSDTLSTVFQVPERPFTHRGLLASAHTTFDPLGIGAPVALGPKLTLRRALVAAARDEKNGWDDPLSGQYKGEWTAWKRDVEETPKISVARCLFPFAHSSCKEIHVFADASLDAIASVAYARSVDAHTGEVYVCFISALSKLAPKAATTVLRLELCAALLACLHALAIQADLNPERIVLYTDSRIVLGYLRNKTKIFVRYIIRRIEAILMKYDESHWFFVPTDCNPADVATRPVSPSQLLQSAWLSGPSFLKESVVPCFDVILSCDLPEAVPSTRSCAVGKPDLFLAALRPLALGISSWLRLVQTVRVIFRLLHFADEARRRLGQQLPARKPSFTFREGELQLFRSAQIESFPFLFDRDGHAILKALPNIPEKHCLAGLVPIIDPAHMLRVGGRLRTTVSSFESKHPLILHHSSQIVKLFVQFVHNQHHQGRMITLNAVRQRGVFVIVGRGLVDRIVKVSSAASCAVQQNLNSWLIYLPSASPSLPLSTTSDLTFLGLSSSMMGSRHDGPKAHSGCLFFW